MSTKQYRPKDVTKFWREAGPDAWFTKDTAFDATFRERFLDQHYAAARRELDGWMETAESALALMILLDQFPRNCFRGTAHMFATDPLARRFARQAIDAGYMDMVDGLLAVFFTLPFEHSEDIADQHYCVEQSRRLSADYLKYAEEHLDIIEKFGRFPHRNAALGRETTSAEKAFLDSGGFSG